MLLPLKIKIPVYNLSLSSLLAFIFLSPIFFSRIFIGGESFKNQEYDDMRGVSLVFLGYITHLLIISAALVTLKLPKKQLRELLIFLSILFLWSCIHIILLVANDPEGMASAIIAIFRQLFWILACIAVVFLVKREALLTTYIPLIKFTMTVAIMSSLFYLLTGIPFQMLLDEDAVRVQGFLSEPSVFGVLLSSITFIALRKSDYFLIFIIICVCLLSSSVIAWFGFICGLSGRWVMLASRKVRGVFYLIICLSILSLPVWLFSVADIVTSNMITVTENMESNEMSYPIEKLVNSGVNLSYVVDNPDYFEKSGGLVRLVAGVRLVTMMSEDTVRYFLGYGLGAHAMLQKAKGDTLLDFNLGTFLISSFGVIFPFLFLPHIILVLAKSEDLFAHCILVALPVFLINSAGGMHIYSLLFVAYLYELKGSSNQPAMVKD